MRSTLFRLALAFFAILLIIGCKPRQDSSVSEAVGAGGGPCVESLAALPTGNPAEAPGREPINKAFKECFKEYLAIDTVNPPGNEDRAAAFFEKVFAAAGILTRRIEVPQVGENGGVKTRTNILAALKPAGDQPGKVWPSILLMNHTDTVAFHPEQWHDPSLPLSGALREFDGEEMMVGRGAIDMKNIGIMQMLTMILIKKSGIELKNALYFLGIADEEANASGIIGLVSEIKKGGKAEELLGAKVAFNEGGFGIKDAIGPGSKLHFVGVEERGGAWLKISEPGGSTDKLFGALSTLRLMPTYSTSAQLGVDKAFAALHRWGCTVGGFNTPGAKANVVPSIVEVFTHCRKGLTQAHLDRVFNFQTDWQALKTQFGYDDGIPDYTVRSSYMGGDVFKLTITTASSGHGSVGAISALDITAWGLQKMRAIYAVKKYPVPQILKYQLTPASSEMLNAVASTHNFARGWLHANDAAGFLKMMPGVVRQKLLKVVGGQAGIEKTFRTACTLTALTRADNSGPLDALVDCRLINLRPITAGGESHSSEFVRQVKDLFASHGLNGLNVELQTGWNFTSTPATGVYYDSLVRALSGQFPGAKITPLMIPGGTDSSYLRDTSLVPGQELGQGIPAFGFTPAMIATPTAETFHGSDERFPTSQMAPAVLSYYALAHILGTAALP